MKLLKSFSKIEQIFISVCFLTLVIGIWHAMPDLNVVGDESPYVGGVFRAMASKTLIPNIDYSYSLSFYANYFLMIPFVAVGLVVFKGNISALKEFLILDPAVAYIVPRIVSMFFAMGILLLFLQIGKRMGASAKKRVVIASLLFTNIIFAVIAHTGKMWMLSFFLFTLAFFYLDTTLRKESSELEALSLFKNPIFYSIFFSFLAFTNFPFNIICLINVPFLLYFFYKNKNIRNKILLSALTGVGFFLVFFFVNHHGWAIQSSTTRIYSFFLKDNLIFWTKGIVLVAPCILLTYVFCARGIKNRKILSVIVLYLVAYVGLALLRAQWAGLSPEDHFRYILYPVAISVLLLFYLEIKNWRAVYFFCAVSLVFFVKVIYLLAVPTTYNQARSYIISHAGNKAVVNNIVQITLPKNKQAYSVTRTSACVTKCQYVLSSPSDIYGLDVFDVDTTPSVYENLMKSAAPKYVIDTKNDTKKDTASIFVASNGLSGNGLYSSVDYNLGPYSLNLLKMSRLGPDIYINLSSSK